MADDKPNLTALREIVSRFDRLLNDKEGEGMLSWHLAVNDVGKELHGKLGSVFGLDKVVPMGEPREAMARERERVDKAINFVCGQLEDTFQRLSQWRSDGCAGEI